MDFTPAQSGADAGASPGVTWGTEDQGQTLSALQRQALADLLGQISQKQVFLDAQPSTALQSPNAYLYPDTGAMDFTPAQSGAATAYPDTGAMDFTPAESALPAGVDQTLRETIRRELRNGYRDFVPYEDEWHIRMLSEALAEDVGKRFKEVPADTLAAIAGEELTAERALRRANFTDANPRLASAGELGYTGSEEAQDEDRASEALASLRRELETGGYRDYLDPGDSWYMENMPSVLAEKIIGGYPDFSRAELTALARQVLEEDAQGKGIEMLADAARGAQEAGTSQYINDPMNWETELYDNIQIRVGGISSDVSGEERTRFLETIVLEEAKKLQNKYRTVYAASDNILATIFSPGLHKKLTPLFTEYSTEEAEINPYVQSFSDSFSRGLFAGLWSEAFKGMPTKSAGKGVAKIGDDFGKLGKLTENPGLSTDWASTTAHGTMRMAERGVTQSMVDSWVANGKVLKQSSGNYLYVTKDGIAVLNQYRELVTTYTKAEFDANMWKVIMQLFGE
jgi:hypothetical protein